jgi:hypothetical protein
MGQVRVWIVSDLGDGGNGKMKDDKVVRPGSMQIDLPTRKARGRLGRDVQNKLGQQLRTAFDEIVNEGVPDKFIDTLRRLDQEGPK